MKLVRRGDSASVQQSPTDSRPVRAIPRWHGKTNVNRFSPLYGVTVQVVRPNR